MHEEILRSKSKNDASADVYLDKYENFFQGQNTSLDNLAEIVEKQYSYMFPKI
jgi:hypothetical protein